MKSHKSTSQEENHYAENQWAKTYGYCYNEETDHFYKNEKHRRDGGVVSPLGDGNELVKIRYSKVNDVFTVTKIKNVFGNEYGKTPRCYTVEETCKALFVPKKTSKSEKKSANAEMACSKKTSKTEKTSDEEDTNTAECALYDTVCTEQRIVRKDKETGEKWSVSLETSECMPYRNYRSSRSGWKKQKDLFINTCYWGKCWSFAFSAPDNIYGAREIRRNISSVFDYLKKKYKDDMPYALIAVEPSEFEGKGWHAHAVVYFPNDIPEDFVATARKLWAKKFKDKEITTTNYLVKVRKINSYEHLVDTLDYLCPTSKKKRHRLKFYPPKFRAMWHIGEPATEVSAVAPEKEVKKITESEYETLRSEYKCLTASQTIKRGEEVVETSVLEYHFSIDWDEVQCYLLKSQGSEAEEILTTSSEEEQAITLTAEEESEQLTIEGVIPQKVKEPWRVINWDCTPYKKWKY